MNNCQHPFMLVDLDSVSDAVKLVSRSILTRQICLWLGDADSLGTLLEDIKKIDASPYLECSFKFHVEGFNKTISSKEQVIPSLFHLIQVSTPLFYLIQVIPSHFYLIQVIILPSYHCRLLHHSSILFRLKSLNSLPSWDVKERST